MCKTKKYEVKDINNVESELNNVESELNNVDTELNNDESEFKTPQKQVSYILEMDLFFVMTCKTLTATALSNIVLYRTCVHSLHYSTDECTPFLSPERTNETKHLEVEVQRYTTHIYTVKSIIEYLGPAILCLFLGVWSDTHGRKPLIVWPLLGMFISSVLTVAYCVIESLGPWWTILIVLPTSLTGSMSVWGTGIYCCLSDMADHKSISLRMMSVELMVALGSVVGSLSCFYLWKAFGNVGVLLIAAIIYIITYVVTKIFLRESLVGAVPGTMSSMFKFALIKKMIIECFKRRPNYLRAQILILVFASSFRLCLQYGLAGLEYLYTREKLHWALKDFNQYSAVNVAITFIGSILMVAVIQRKFNISDLIVSIVAFVSSTAEYTIKAFAVTTWHMYFASSVSAFGGLSAPLIRSFLTKVVPAADIAKVFALMSAIAGVVPLVSPPVYNSLYNVTLASFPGAVMLLSSSLCGSGVVMILVVVYLRRKRRLDIEV